MGLLTVGLLIRCNLDMSEYSRVGHIIVGLLLRRTVETSDYPMAFRGQYCTIPCQAIWSTPGLSGPGRFRISVNKLNEPRKGEARTCWLSLPWNAFLLWFELGEDLRMKEVQ